MAFIVNENSFSSPSELSAGSKVASGITCKYNAPLFSTPELYQRAQWRVAGIPDGYASAIRKHSSHFQRPHLLKCYRDPSHQSQGDSFKLNFIAFRKDKGNYVILGLKKVTYDYSLPARGYCSPGDIWQYLKTLILVVTTWRRGGATGI